MCWIQLKAFSKAEVYAFQTYISQIYLRCYYATQFYFFIHLHFKMCFSPARIISCRLHSIDSEPRRMYMSSWKSPGAESSAFLTLSYLEHRFVLLVIFWHLWITIMLSYLQLQSSLWERSQLLEAFAVKKKKKKPDFSIIHWKRLCERIYSVSEMLAITLLGNT